MTRSSRQRALPAKISGPRAQQAIDRPRLFDQLDRALEQHGLVWVQAPAGAGKTTLAGSYLAARSLTAIWYQVDSRDADPASVFYYLGLADVRGDLPLLTSEYIAGIDAFTRNYFEKLFERQRSPFALVLDDFQGAEPSFARIVATAAEMLPAGSHIIVSSREPPPAAFASLRGTQRLALISGEQLRLTLDEARELTRARTPAIEEDAVRRWHEATGGWAAGLVLLAERGTWSDPLPGGRQALFDYLAQEVLDRTDAATQSFLLASALLPRMYAGVTGRLTGRDAEPILADLAHRGYFTSRLTDSDAFAYHPLFRRFLEHAARERLAPEQLRDLRERAARELLAEGKSEEAAELLAAAGSFTALAELIREQAGSLLQQGRNRTLNAWIDELPEAIATGGWMRYWRGMALALSDPAAAHAHFVAAFGRFREDGDAEGLYRCWSAIVAGIFHLRDAPRTATEWVATFAELRRDFPAYPSAETADWCAGAMFMALVMTEPDHPELDTWRRRALLALGRTNDPLVKLQAVSALVYHYVWTGSFTRARVLLTIVDTLARTSGAKPAAGLFVDMLRAWIEWCTGRFAEAGQRAVRTLERAEEIGAHPLDARLHVHGATAAMNAGDLNRADQHLGALSAALARMPANDRCFYHCLASWRAALAGEAEAAQVDAIAALDLAERLGLAHMRALTRICLAAAEHGVGATQDARATIEEAARWGERCGSAILRFAAGMHAAAFVDADEERAGDREQLAAVLGLGRRRRYLMTLFWYPDLMARVCDRALAAGVEVAYVKRLIHTRGLVPGPGASARWPWPVRIETLGELHIRADDEPLRWGRKSPKKPLELLQALIAMGGRAVAQERLIAALWPDADGDAGYRSFVTTLHRLRNLIGKDALHLSSARLELDHRRVWVDLWALEQQLGDIDRLLGEPIAGDGQLLHAAETLGALYRGPFLADQPEASWMVAPREGLRARVTRAHQRLGEALVTGGAPAEAEQVFQRGLAVDAAAEPMYQGLMRSLHAQGRRADALAAFGRCQRVLSAEHGVAPSPATVDLAARIKNTRAAVRR